MTPPAVRNETLITLEIAMSHKDAAMSPSLYSASQVAANLGGRSASGPGGALGGQPDAPAPRGAPVCPWGHIANDFQFHAILRLICIIILLYEPGWN